MLRRGSAGSNTAADRITVLDAALAQVPDAHRARPILVRVDGAGFSHALLEHLTDADLQYSVGFPTNAAVRAAIEQIPAWLWRPAVTADGGLGDGADVAEITDLLTLGGWPGGMRVIVRRERPHPGAQLDAFEERDGYRYQAVATNTAHGQLQFLEARHRAHARVEDRIRCGKDTGIGRFPSRSIAINAIWLELALTAADLPGLHPNDAPRRGRGVGPGRAEETAVPAATHRRPDHPRTTTSVPVPGQELALAKAFARLRLIPLPV